MRVLVTTDFHGQEALLGPLRTTVSRLKPDVVFCLGDLTERVRGAVAFTEAYLEAVGAAIRPVVCVSGNNDQTASLAVLKERGVLLDGRERVLGSATVVGLAYGSAVPYEADLTGAVC